MDIQVAQTLFDSMDASLKTLVTGGAAKVMIGLAGLFGTFWMLSFTIRSLQWLYAGMDVIFKDVFMEILKMAIIVSMAFNVSWYVETIVPFVTGLPTWMGGILSGHEGSQINQVDTMIGSYVDGFLKLVKSMKIDIFDLSLSDIYLSAQAVVFYLMGGIPFILVAVGTTFTLQGATTILLALGPVFIAFALFDQTRHWCMGWISTLAGFMLTHVMFAIVLALEISFINSKIIKNGEIDTSLIGNFSMLVYFLSFTVLATELPNYAASIMGGASSGGVTGMGGILKKATGVGTAMKLGGFAAKHIGNRFGNKLGSA